MKAPSKKTSEVEPQRSNFHLWRRKLDPPQHQRMGAVPLPLCISQHATWTLEVNRSLYGSAITTLNEVVKKQNVGVQILSSIYI